MSLAGGWRVGDRVVINGVTGHVAGRPARPAAAAVSVAVHYDDGRLVDERVARLAPEASTLKLDSASEPGRQHEGSSRPTNGRPAPLDSHGDHHAPPPTSFRQSGLFDRASRAGSAVGGQLSEGGRHYTGGPPSHASFSEAQRSCLRKEAPPSSPGAPDSGRSLGKSVSMQLEDDAASMGPSNAGGPREAWGEQRSQASSARGILVQGRGALPATPESGGNRRGGGIAREHYNARQVSPQSPWGDGGLDSREQFFAAQAAASGGGAPSDTSGLDADPITSPWSQSQSEDMSQADAPRSQRRHMSPQASSESPWEHSTGMRPSPSPRPGTSRESANAPWSKQISQANGGMPRHSVRSRTSQESTASPWAGDTAWAPQPAQAAAARRREGTARAGAPRDERPAARAQATSPEQDAASSRVSQAEDIVLEKLRRNWSTLRDAFRALDRSNTGYVSRADFKEAMRSVFLPSGRFSTEDIEELARLFDLDRPDHDGNLSYDEFARLVEQHQHVADERGHRVTKLDAAFQALREAVETRHGSLRVAFRAMDRNRTSSLTPDEFAAGLRALGLRVTPEQQEGLWQRFVQEGADGISFAQFSKVLSKAPDLEHVARHMYY